MLPEIDLVETHIFSKQESWETLFLWLDELALQVAPKLPNRYPRGQFFTPMTTAQFMASLFVERPEELRVLDAGTGLGALSVALLAQACQWKMPPRHIHLTAIEVEPVIVSYLERTLQSVARIVNQYSISFQYQIIQDNFLEIASDVARGRTLLQPSFGSFNAAILNPPYGKLLVTSRIVRQLKRAHVEANNQYAAFVWLVIQLLESDGELVTITPRSFSNGLYFRPFRRFLASHLSLRRVHVFDERKDIFRRDRVLQETIIIAASKKPQEESIVISTSARAGDDLITERIVPAAEVFHPNDPENFLRIVPDEIKHSIGSPIRLLNNTLGDLGLSISTGRVVEFRATDLLQRQSDESNVPLIHPHNLVDGYVRFSNGESRKPVAIAKHERNLLIPRGTYVLVKRFTTKEETRRIVAAVLDPKRVKGEWFAFENHLNYFHSNGQGFDSTLARGLAGYLNSTMVDEFLRQFSGHTQINATDLRNLKYPSEQQLIVIGEKIGDKFPPQAEIDEIVLGAIDMEKSISLNAKRKIEQAREILAALGVPKEQQNQRSALTLLGLANMKPSGKWLHASAPLVGIHELMAYFAKYYGVRYAENTRETVRRFTMHQFLQLGLAIKNPDEPERPINSPETRYQIEPTFLKLVQSFATKDWERNLSAYLRTAQEIHRLKARERNRQLFPVTLPNGVEVVLTAGGQNNLIGEIIREFCSRYTPSGKILYLGDAGKKLTVYDEPALAKLGIRLDKHGKMPDVIVYYQEKQWLVLIEAVTSHGPIGVKRHNELKELFKNSLPLVFVTAFPSRKEMMRYLPEIAWETEVWTSESPDHLIHFNGERFLGPYG